MSLILDGTNGLSDVDGTAATPAIRGTDTNTGIFFPAADTIAFAEGGTEVARIDSNGNFGVGTASPVSLLDVRNGTGSVVTLGKTSAFAGGQSSYIKWQEGSTQLADIGWDANNNEVRINNRVAGFTSFYTSNTERMRITSGGSLLVGSTNENGRLYVEGSDAGNTFGARNTNASYAATVGFFGANRNTTNNSFWFIDCYNFGAGSYKFRVADSGNVTNTNGSYGTISDVKLKENIVDATSKLDKVNQLQVRNYNFIGDDLKQIGFVAQEFEQVFPSLVDESVDKDVDGNDLGTTTKTIKTTVLIPILVKAIQEQQAMITSLTARIAALENPPVESVTNE